MKIAKVLVLATHPMEIANSICPKITIPAAINLEATLAQEVLVAVIVVVEGVLEIKEAPNSKPTSQLCANMVTQLWLAIHFEEEYNYPHTPGNNTKNNNSNSYSAFLATPKIVNDLSWACGQ